MNIPGTQNDLCFGLKRPCFWGLTPKIGVIWVSGRIKYTYAFQHFLSRTTVDPVGRSMMGIGDASFFVHTETPLIIDKDNHPAK